MGNNEVPQSVTIILSNQVFIPKINLPPNLINKINHLAAFQNPEFYIAQSMRFSRFGKPRIIACAENFTEYIGLPRGCLEEVMSLLSFLGIKIVLEDKRYCGQPIKAKFLGKLTSDQQKSATAIITYENGILAATTG